MDNADTEQESTPPLSDQLPEDGTVHGEVGVPPHASYYYVCQVEACGTTLTTAYDKKCRTCATHRKADDVLIEGELQRFCQKCSRFHTLGEFDEGRRNCRRQLMEHNRRQRRLRRLRRTNADDDAPPPRHIPESRAAHHYHDTHVPQSQIDALLAAAASSHQRGPVAPAAPMPQPAFAGPGMTLTDLLLVQQLVERTQYDYALQTKVAELLANLAGLGVPPPGSAGLAPPPPPPPRPVAPPPQAPPPLPLPAAWAGDGTTHYPQPTRPTNGQSLEELRHLEQALAAALGLQVPGAVPPPSSPPPPPDNPEQNNT